MLEIQLFKLIFNNLTGLMQEIIDIFIIASPIVSLFDSKPINNSEKYNKLLRMQSAITPTGLPTVIFHRPLFLP